MRKYLCNNRREKVHILLDIYLFFPIGLFVVCVAEAGNVLVTKCTAGNTFALIEYNFRFLHCPLVIFAVPPVIVASETTDHVMVEEGEDVTLKCKATGLPTPSITWTREDNGLLRPKGQDKGKVRNLRSMYLLFQIPQAAAFKIA